MFARFETPNDVLDQGSGKLTVVQQYLFTNYSDRPSHEPSGTLNAARLYPLLYFSFSKPEKIEKAPKYVRVDYRLELALDTQLDNVPKQGLSWTDPASLIVWNTLSQAGIFKDNDNLNYKLLHDIYALGRGQNAIFDREEKPLKFEVIGQGLNHGNSGKWDNIHFWSYKNNELPSTPGAFHAVHIHWRWFVAASAASALDTQPWISILRLCLRRC